MLVLFSPIFVADAKIINGYNFVAPLISKYITSSLVKKQYTYCAISHEVKASRQ